MILTCLDEVRDDWEENPKLDLHLFPLSQLHEQITALDAIVRSEFDELDQTIKPGSLMHEQVISLYYRFHLSSEFVASSKVLESVEKRFERIDAMLPARNYAVRDLLVELNAADVGPAIKKGLESALHKFDRQEYKEVLRECREIGESLFRLYVINLGQAGCNGIPGKMGFALEYIRKWLADERSKDKKEYPFAPRSRIEWFLLSLFESLLYIGNAASHSIEQEERLPEWQRQRRGFFVEKPESARLISIVA